MTNHAKNRGLIPLADKMDQRILKRFKKLQGRGAAEIHDPDRWMEVIRGVARVGWRL